MGSNSNCFRLANLNLSLLTKTKSTHIELHTQNQNTLKPEQTKHSVTMCDHHYHHCGHGYPVGRGSWPGGCRGNYCDGHGWRSWVAPGGTTVPPPVPPPVSDIPPLQNVDLDSRLADMTGLVAELVAKVDSLEKKVNVGGAGGK